MKSNNSKTTRSDVIQFRVSKGEHQLIRENCKKAGMSESEYLRRLVSGSRIEGNINIVRDAAKHGCMILSYCEQLEHMENSKSYNIIEAIKQEASALCRY